MDAQKPAPTPAAQPAQPPLALPPPERKIGRKAAIIGTIIALLVVIGVGWLAWGLTHREPAAAGGPGSPGGPGGGGGQGAAGGRGGSTVGVAAAERADIPITLEALGTVVPQATVRVRPQVSGVLQQLLFKEGQMVRKGELLAIIDPRQFEMALQQASGQRQRDEAQLEAANVTLQRYRTLLQQDSIARQEVDTQAALVKQLDAAVVISKANEGVARLNLSYTRVVSPIAGRVGLRTVDVGNVVSSGDTNGVALVTQISPIDVEFSVPQDMAPSLQATAGSQMQVDALDRTRAVLLESGSFGSLDNQIDTTTGTVRAKARFKNEKLLMFPSQFVNVKLQLRTVEGAIVVPVAALRTGANGDYVFVLKQDRTVTIRPVKRGQATIDKVQIVSGLQAGERVITEGADRLREGSRVTLPGDPGAGARTGGRRQGGASGAAGTASGAAGAMPGAAGAMPGTAGATPGSAVPMSPASGTPAADPVTGATPEGAPQGRRQRASGAGRPDGQQGAAAADATTRPAAAAPAGAKGPTAEQRQRMLDAAAGDPEQLARRKAFLAKLDAGDPEAIERWQKMQERRREGGGAGAGGGGGRPAQ
ncbi:MAG: efflux RND transporter periplasmic adaptor subunit [Comamonadaceae bacterium]|nr:MAG: efflux RND transporter periplasmic adaptor subunit [Comamonadaceae bacterium]